MQFHVRIIEAIQGTPTHQWNASWNTSARAQNLEAQLCRYTDYSFVLLPIGHLNGLDLGEPLQNECASNIRDFVIARIGLNRVSRYTPKIRDGSKELFMFASDEGAATLAHSPRFSVMEADDLFDIGLFC